MKHSDYLIEADELQTKIDDPGLCIYDATILFYMGMTPEEAARMPSARERYQAGHIPGAAFLDQLEFSDTSSFFEYMLAPDEQLAEAIGRIGITNDAEVVVYTTAILACATRAWWVLRYAGVENIRVLNGGLDAWKAMGAALEQGERAYPHARFEPQFAPAMFASKEEVQAAIGQAGVRIEDALIQDWHDQEHIPGSVCLPLTELTIGWETFLPQEDLKARLTDAGRDRRIITYCGGGIAATLNAMAYRMVGHENVAVYDGSLSEWKGEGLPLTGKA